MKDGYYAIYKGKEFRCSIIKTKIKLISNDQKDIALGFYPSKRNPDLYIKEILLNEAEDIYYINPKAKYKGETFQAPQKKKDKILLVTGNEQTAKKYKFEWLDKYVFGKYVDISEVELTEEKKSLNL